MCCELKRIMMDEVSSGETWAGISYQMTSSDDTEFANNLSRVRMTFKTAAGVSSLTLDSNGSGEITIDSAASYGWAFTVEPRILSLTSGWYSWAVETTDSTGRKNKDFIAGTVNITPDPHA
jgi:hypothetical protein